MAGDFILSVASILITRLKNEEVTIILSQVRILLHFYSYVYISPIYNSLLSLLSALCKFYKSPLIENVIVKSVVSGNGIC